MIFEQLFDTKSSTYTYIISSGKGREALIIDPVIEHTDEYIKVLDNLELKLKELVDHNKFQEGFFMARSLISEGEIWARKYFEICKEGLLNE